MAVRPPGLIELPGMKGEIRIEYDLTTSRIELQAQAISYANLGQVLIAALSQAIAMWAQEEARIIRPKGQDDGNKEKTSDPTNDHNG
jgi:hypothetical protein